MVRAHNHSPRMKFAEELVRPELSALANNDKRAARMVTNLLRLPTWKFDASSAFSWKKFLALVERTDLIHLRLRILDQDGDEVFFWTPGAGDA